MNQFPNDDLDREISDALGDMSLMDMVDAEEASRRGTTAGSAANTRRGIVISVQKDDILVDLGGKSTGVLPVVQLGDEPLPNVGDSIEVMVTGYKADEGLITLSRQDAVLAATWETLRVGQIVEGMVKGHNKGGLELKIDGIKAFMPISQIELSRVEDEDLPGFLNRKLQCKVAEIRRADKALVVTRRELLKEEEARQREARFETLKEGQLVTGTVRTIMPYGAFVDIGGVDGLLHIGDMGHKRTEDPKEVVHQGQQLELMVLKIDREHRKIGLGLKQTLADPWEDVENKWPVDSIVSCRVLKLMEFGAFIELEPGIEGLIPISEMSYTKRVNHPRELLAENDVVKVRILSIDPLKKRIAVSLKQAEDDPWMGASLRWPADSVVSGRVTRLAPFGAFLELTPGVEGLIHISELSDAPVRNVAEVVREGDTIGVKVLDVDEDRRRISLSVKQVALMPDYTGHAEGEPASDSAKPPRKRKKPLKGGLEW